MNQGNWDFGWLGSSRITDSQRQADTIINITSTTSDSRNWNRNQMKINLEELLLDYDLDFGMFTDLDDRLLEIEDKLYALKAPERIILILYAEYKSYRKVGKILGFSHSTVMKHLKEIKEKLC